ncbi:MAG: PrsW family intramembrane metalloprotease [Clostridia bacterium]|nr:PrsW family intramembrane metalloprotease [Clostridia bacterium]
MQNSLQGDEKSKNKRVKEKLKFFFKETFRPHTKEEYAEVFTRGLGDNCSENIARKLPWLYIRVFALNVILFAIIAFAFRLARYTADYQTAILTGGLLFNVPLFILAFELYPKRDLSLLKLCAALLIGGVISTVIITLGYEYIYSTVNEPNVWISTLWVGFWEEFIKGAVAIAAIFILGKKNPFYCFLIGFAVGTGYSFTEDLGYIYSLSRSYGTGWLVLTSVGRGLSCVCSHAPWTAMICWAFAKFKKPFINFRFYGIVIAMMALHYFADVPFFDDNLNILRGVTVGWAIEAGVVAAIFIAVFFALKSCFKELYFEGKPEIYQPEPITISARISHTANLTAVLCAVVLSVFAFAGCCIKTGEKAITEKVDDVPSLIDRIQDGLPLYANWEREYDKDSDDYTRYFVEGQLAGATQRETDGDCNYFYVYAFEDGQPILENIAVKVKGVKGLHYVHLIQVFEDAYFDWFNYPRYTAVPDIPDEEEAPPEVEEPDITEPEPTEPEEPSEPKKPILEFSYFYMNNSLSIGYDRENKEIFLWTGKTEFEGLGSIIALSTLAGATLIGGSAAFITLKIKARRNKDA